MFGGFRGAERGERDFAWFGIEARRTLGKPSHLRDSSLTRYFAKVWLTPFPSVRTPLSIPPADWGAPSSAAPETQVRSLPQACRRQDLDRLGGELARRLFENIGKEILEGIFISLPEGRDE